LGRGEDPIAYVVSANIRRRHLTSEAKRKVVAGLLKERPERSDRATARLADTNHPTVAAVRRELVEAGDVENLSTRSDSRGRQQPATKPARPPKVSKLDQIRALREQRRAAPPISKAGAAFPAERPEPPAVRDIDELKSVLAGAVAVVTLDPARAVGLAGELIQAARRRL
jgi:hypothetical protein